MARSSSARSVSPRSTSSTAKKKSAPSAKSARPTATPKGRKTRTQAKLVKDCEALPAPSTPVRAVVEPAAVPSTGLKEADLTAIWITYKRTLDQNLRNILIEHHMPLVKMIAERLLQTLPRSIDIDDLTSAGTFGLMDAINGFDLSRGIKFKTYCTTRIRGSILDELRSQDWVPRLVRLKAHKLERTLRKLEGELGRLPNTFEMADAMELTIDELADTEKEANAKAIFSLSEKWDDGDDDKEMEKVEILADKKVVDPLQTIQQRDALDVVTRNLTKKERLIVIMYYYEGLTMREIGEIMELTESRVCQIHSNVMTRLKGQLDRMQLQDA